MQSHSYCDSFFVCQQKIHDPLTVKHLFRLNQSNVGESKKKTLLSTKLIILNLRRTYNESTQSLLKFLSVIITMCLNRRFLVVCLIVYAMFQFYQAFSSLVFVFFESREYYGVEIKTLTSFQIVGLCFSSICLILGSLKSKVNLLIAGLCYLLYKVGFIIWHFKAFYEIALDCRDTNQSPCDPNRLKVIYQHIAISCE